MQILSTISEVRALRKYVQNNHQTLGLVPTMGALHDGHLSLVKLACEQTDHALVTIFVNPTQFAPHEDFQQYPRTLEQDLATLQQMGVEYVYTPDKQEIYHENFQTMLHIEKLSTPLCGQSRPHFFKGVALIVCKLFHQTQADKSFFWRKRFSTNTCY